MRRALSVLLSVVALVWLTVGTASADREYSWTLDKDNNRLPSPEPYLYDSQIDGMYLPSGEFKNPSDIFVDAQYNVWIADTGNNRVLKFDPSGAFLQEIGTQEGEGLLNGPEGVFIADDSTIWVADRGNGRVVQYAPDGTFLKALGKPESKLLEADQVYQPSKLVLDKRGYLYVLNGGGDYRGIFLLDIDGEFRGFFGANRLNFDLGRLLIRMFTTDAQKKQISKVLPTHHANLFVDPRGFVYTVSPLADTEQIKKLNAIGLDVYGKDKTFGEFERRDTQVVKPQFVDLTVDAQGIVSALDFNSGRIYQYDQSGNLLDIFGGRGAERGNFELPQSIAVGKDGQIYVLDANRNNVQIFRPTEFASLLHQGSQLYFDGKYEEAAAVWRQVLHQDANLELAHTGLGKAYFRQGDYLAAMKEYAIARNKDGYSQAFGEWRHDFLRANFGWVFPLVIFACWVITALVSRTVRRVSAMDIETEPMPGQRRTVSLGHAPAAS
jgi:DNA-binding beta-propeller fold protein YncE